MRVWRGVLMVVAAATMLGAGSADAQSSGGRLGGVKGSASASGMNAYYNPAGLLPIAAPVDFGAPDALATISSGSATFARASAADPGDLLANPDALIQAGAGSSWKAGTIPAYPYRVSASSSVGAPTREVSPAPGLDARVHADEFGSTALATMPSATGPAVLTTGSMASTATTATDGSTVTLTARSIVQNVDLLGIVKIDSIVTDLTAASAGQATDLKGGTTVTGASMAGQPVTIDASGIHSQSGTPLNELLASAGIRITVAAPFEQATATSGELDSAGLRIDLEISDRTLPILATLRDSLPFIDNPVPGAPGIEDVVGATRARNLVAISLSRAGVSLSARPAAARSPAPVVPGAPASPSLNAPLPAVAAPAARVPSTPSLNAAAPAREVVTAATSGIHLSDGVGGAAVLLLLLQPLLGNWLARTSTGLLAEDSVMACPREGQ